MSKIAKEVAESCAALPEFSEIAESIQIIHFQKWITHSPPSSRPAGRGGQRCARPRRAPPWAPRAVRGPRG